VWITSPQLKLIGHVGIRLPPRLRKKFVRNVLVSIGIRTLPCSAASCTSRGVEW
jgi:hypothetical protein